MGLFSNVLMADVDGSPARRFARLLSRERQRRDPHHTAQRPVEADCPDAQRLPDRGGRTTEAPARELWTCPRRAWENEAE